MNPTPFTPKAALLWGTIAPKVQKRILEAVYCGKCQNSVQIVKYAGKGKKEGDLILEGFCEICGHEVARIVEVSETPVENN